MSVCIRCAREIPLDASAFCPFCGASQTAKQKPARKRRMRGNGQGCAYRRGSSWTASVIVGWKVSPDPSKPKYPVKRTRGGFATKKEALEYCQQLRLDGDKRVRISLEDLYKRWEPFYAPRIGASALDGYKYAFNHFKKLHGIFIDSITTEDLQSCMDECKAGKRTHENMKTIASLLWKYAVDRDLADRNIAANLFTGHGKSIQREPVTPEEEKKIRDSIGKYRYATYIYCLCWLGYRPGEMLELRKDQLFCEILPADDECEETPVWFFINGQKTPAGRDRVVIVPDEILPYILDRLFVPGTDLMFPQYVFSRGEKPRFKEFKQMSHEFFNKHVFKPMMEKLGIAKGKTPYCARHSYADKLKKAHGSDKDKAELIGHATYLFTQNHYQSVDLKDLRDLVNSFE